MTDLQAHIGRRFKQSVVLSVMAKLSACVLQLISIPIAVRYLGVDGYAAFATILAASLAPQMFVLRHGPILTGPIAAMFSVGDWPAIALRMWAAFGASLLSMVLSILAFASLYGLGALQGLVTSEGSAVPMVLGTMLFLTAMHLFIPLLIVFEDTQAALHESHLQGLRVTIGNVLAMIAIAFLVPHAPSLFCYAVALTGPPFLVRAMNAFMFLFRYRRLLLKFPKYMPAQIRISAHNGLLFTAVVGVGAYASNQLPIIAAATFLTEAQTASVSVIQQLTLVAFAFGSVLGVGFLPAFNTCLSSGNPDWVRRTLQRIEQSFVGLGIICVLGFVLFGRPLHNFLLRMDLAIPREAIWFAGVYAVLLIIENFYFLLATSIRQSGRSSLLFTVRAGLTGLAAYITCQAGYPAMIWLAGAALTLLITVFHYRSLVWMVVDQSMLTPGAAGQPMHFGPSVAPGSPVT